LKVTGTVLTLLLMYLILKYHLQVYEIMMVQGRVLDEVPFLKSFYHSGLIKGMLLELFVCAIHPLPFVAYDITVVRFGHKELHPEVYHADAFISVLMFLRLPLLMPRLIAELSGMQNEKTRIIGTLNGVKVDFVLIVKDLIQSNLMVLMMLVVILILTYAYAFVIFERVHPHSKITSYENAMWLTIITMTTVGYGDMFPNTICGRAVAVITAITAVVMTALAVNTVIVRLSLTREETKVLDFIDQMESRKNLKRAAALYIQRAIRSFGENHPSKFGMERCAQQMPRDIKFASAALQFRETHQHHSGGGISTDVPLTTTENQVILQRLEKNMIDITDQLKKMSQILNHEVGRNPR